jgi:hypothetical protein
LEPELNPLQHLTQAAPAAVIAKGKLCRIRIAGSMSWKPDSKTQIGWLNWREGDQSAPACAQNRICRSDSICFYLSSPDRKIFPLCPSGQIIITE